MKYAKAFKFECIRMYKAGEPIEHPGGCTYQTFMHKVRNWARIYDALGQAGLEHKKPERSWKDKMRMLGEVQEGASVNSVALANGIQCDLLARWIKIYEHSGADGLRLTQRRGRPPNMGKKPSTSDQPKVPINQKELEQEVELLRAENEYLKKLRALVQKRKGRQPKTK